MTIKKHVVQIFEPGTYHGRFCVEDNPANSSVSKYEDIKTINVPLSWAIACVKAAGYKVYKEI